MSRHDLPLHSDALVAGVDEAGRGPLAGPVSVAAVILDPSHPIDGLDDSKRLSPRKREALFEQIIARVTAFHIVFVEREEIDRVNILQATMLGMLRAVAGLHPPASRVLIDGNRLPVGLPCPGQAMVGGDGSEPAISAASILAKVSRDHHMVEMDARFPGYGFARHKGYGTAAHLQALAQLGACPEHRRSFAPVRRCLTPPQAGGALLHPV